jgi:iron complex outermembrane receptor protein
MRLQHLKLPKNVSSMRTRALSFPLILLLCFTVIYPVAVSANRNALPPVSMLADRVISGKVTDEATGTPLSGATVSVKGTNNSTTTNANGAYSISVKDNSATLVFTFVGYTTKEVPVGAASTLDVTLKIASAELAEVVIGYGTLQKKDVTGSVKSLQPGDFNKGIINSPEQ